MYEFDATLLGTLDDRRIGPRRGSAMIRDYFAELLKDGPISVTFHTAVSNDTVHELGAQFASHAGYYDFSLPSGRTLIAKFGFVYHLSAVRTPIMMHVSGLAGSASG